MYMGLSFIASVVRLLVRMQQHQKGVTDSENIRFDQPAFNIVDAFWLLT
jgi:hypothetical protein